VYVYRSAIQNALQMVHQLKILNAQLVEKISDTLKYVVLYICYCLLSVLQLIEEKICCHSLKRVIVHHIVQQAHNATVYTWNYSIAGNIGTHNNNQILTMYTNEAVKCGRYTLIVLCMHACLNAHIWIGWKKPLLS